MRTKPSFHERFIYSSAPVTAHGAGMLAKSFNYANTWTLAESLEGGSVVADFGAGASPLGKRVCEMRDDVQWINIDLGYEHQSLRRRAARNAPANLHFLAADVLQFKGELKEESFDRVFSYWDDAAY